MPTDEVLAPVEGCTAAAAGITPLAAVVDAQPQIHSSKGNQEADASPSSEAMDTDDEEEAFAHQMLQDARDTHFAAQKAQRVAEVVPLRIETGQTLMLPPLQHHLEFLHTDAPPATKAPRVYESVVANPKPVGERIRARSYYEVEVARTPEQCMAERAYEQGSEQWRVEARGKCITGSQFGPAIGLGYERDEAAAQDEVIHDKLWDIFEGNEATRWGNEHEKHANEAFEAWFPQYLHQRYLDHGRSKEDADAAMATIVFHSDNLIKYAETAWMGVSPDRLVTYVDWDGVTKTDLAEYKCAYYFRNKQRKTHPYDKYHHAFFAANVPQYYGAQMQGIMGYINAHLGSLGGYPRAIGQCWFFVWTPTNSWVTLQPYDDNLFKTYVFPRLQEFYFKRLLPALVHKANGQLNFDASTKRGDIRPQVRIDDLL